ncbi:GNAT family N-acetyltransferase [Ralstonia pseudosolanacearum]|uniref:GNAT family N-acetyltransferase n=1 Tax=Ralstonia pseudosolanacearum TaxID=1310165 RepID=UPI003D05CF72
MQFRRTSLQTLLALQSSAEFGVSRDLIESLHSFVDSHVKCLAEHVAPKTVQDAYEHVVLLAERDSRIVGYCWGYYLTDSRCMEVFAGYIDPECRRQGFASASFREMVNIGRDAGKNQFKVRFSSKSDERTGLFDAIARYAHTLPKGVEVELSYWPRSATIRGQRLTVPLRFVHETSPLAALQILRSRKFVVAGMYRDAVLNGELPGETLAEQAAATGAVLTFEWSGPVNNQRPDFYDPNVLYDERPNRVHVFVGTDRHLRLTDIALREGATWTEALTRTTRPTGAAWRDPQAWRDWLCPKSTVVRRTRALAEEVHRRVAEKPTITVDFPGDYPMHLLLRGRGSAGRVEQADATVA